MIIQWQCKYIRILDLKFAENLELFSRKEKQSLLDWAVSTIYFLILKLPITGLFLAIVSRANECGINV